MCHIRNSLTCLILLYETYFTLHTGIKPAVLYKNHIIGTSSNDQCREEQKRLVSYKSAFVNLNSPPKLGSRRFSPQALRRWWKIISDDEKRGMRVSWERGTLYSVVTVLYTAVHNARNRWVSIQYT